MRLVNRAPYFLLGSLLSFSLVACGGGGDDDDDDVTPGGECYENPGTPECVDPAGSDTQYVVSQITMPVSATQAQQLGLDLDGDPQGRPDNALGQILSTLAQQGGINLQESVDAQVADGGIILLVNVRATALATAPKVGAWVMLGDSATPVPSPCVDENDTVCGRHLDGAGVFTIASSSPMDAILAGQIVAGKFTGGPGEVTLQIALGTDSAPISLNLVGARMEVTTSATGLMSGKLGGAVTKGDLDANVLPAIVTIMEDTIGADCAGGTPPDCCPEGSTGATLVDLFDDCTDGSDSCDCAVDLEELKTNSLIASLLAPDVDLLDGAGKFNPRQDDTKDSLSLGIGFTGVNGTFPAP
jgi:hypothetical protein